MRTLLKKSFLVSIGLLSMTREKAQKIMNELSQRGEVQKDEVKDWVEQLVHRGEEERQAVRELIHDEVKSILDELGLARKEDIRDLVNKIEAIVKEGE
ncbi:MAG TPA: polyhydroxyalkanoate synthesis regulator [Bacteroidaceae bacterium]|nr:polyhydroxyalkanoate synthesis regulator [Bacteroidaceae bacterium]